MKILELINSLSIQEIQKFEKFINSTYFNENVDITNLYNAFIGNAIKSSNPKELKKRFLQKYTWSDGKFRKACNDLLELLLEYNMIESVRSNELVYKTTKYNAILFREWHEKLINKRNEIYYLKRTKNAWTEIELAQYYIFVKAQLDSNTSNPEDSLKLYAEVAQIKKEFLSSSDISSKIDLENFKQSNYEITPEILRNVDLITNKNRILFQEIEKIFKGQNFNEHFNRVQQLLLEINIPKKQKSKIIDQCTSYLAIKLNQGNLDMAEDLFNVYKFAIDNSLIIVEVTDYRNIAYLACRSKEFEWALKFVEDYKPKLPLEDQESAYSFTKARTLWYAKDWEGVISTLRNVEYKDMTYNLLSKIILMTCYYELDEDDALDSFIKAFKVFLRRKRNISKRRKDAFYGFTTVIGDLMKARERNDPKRLTKAREELSNNPSIPNQDWLTEKIEELEAVIKPSKK